MKGLLFLAVGALALQGCSDDFLKEKHPYDSGGWEIFNNEGLLKGKIAKLYELCLPSAGTAPGGATPSTGDGSSNLESQATLEYGGNDWWNNGEKSPMDYTTAPAYLATGKATEGPYTRIREANVVLHGLDLSTLPEDVLRPFRGEAYFWRAWLHLYLFTYYGGIPVLDHMQNPVGADFFAEDSPLKVNRSTSADTFKFISDDLDQAIGMLPDTWPAADYGRLTKSAAAALKGRLYLLWASPLFNRQDDATRWTNAYEVCLDAYNRCINNGGRKLVSGNAAANGKAWADMFTQWDSPEGVMVTLYNNLSPTDQLSKNNNWENGTRPQTQANPNGSGKSATAEMVDLFPMADGLKPGGSYDPELFFVDRDPRFYRTFAFPGSVWGYKGNESQEMWQYTWYDKQELMDNPKETGFSGNYVKTPASGVYVRKKTSASAVYDAATYFRASNSPLFEIRMGEVVLNLAEAAAGANNLGDGFKYLRMIRERVYGADSPYATSDFGLTAAKADRKSLLSAIVYERQIELAYEGKRFYDMRRWLLFDGGVGAEGGAWKTGNTLNYLDNQTINGTRRHGLHVMYPAIVPGPAAATPQFDPLKDIRPSGLNPDAGLNNFRTQMTNLAAFYSQNLKRKDTDNLDNGDGRKFSFLPYYYFLGLRKNAMEKMTYMWQNVGWQDIYLRDGTFNPLSDALPAPLPEVD